MRDLRTEPAVDIFRRFSKHVKESALSRIEMIAEFPKMYPVRQHEPYAGFRFFLVEHCCLSYVLAEDAIIILAVSPLVEESKRTPDADSFHP